MILDYNKICEDILTGDRSKMAVIGKLIQAFHNEPISPTLRKKVQAMKIQALGLTVSTDFAETLNTAFNAFFEMANFYMAWEQYFKTVPVSPYKLSWEIHNVKNGLAFRKVAEGETIEVFGMTSTKQTIYADKYGGALGWTDELIRGREVAAMADKAETFRNRFYEVKADAHYLLLMTAAALKKVAWQGVVADGQLRRDIQTINKGCYDIGFRCKDKGYGNTENPGFILTADPIFKNRIEACFQATTPYMSAAQGKADQIGYSVRRNYTFNSKVAGKIFIGMPGLKSQKADFLQPTNFTDTNILNLTYIQAVWAYYGAGVGDSERYAELKFA